MQPLYELGEKMSYARRGSPYPVPGRGMGASPACPTPSDTSYPSGCPAGFSLQESYYVPNSEVINATASTPGAIPLTSTNGCPSYSCVNAQQQSPYGALDAQ